MKNKNTFIFAIVIICIGVSNLLIVNAYFNTFYEYAHWWDVIEPNFSKFYKIKDSYIQGLLIENRFETIKGFDIKVELLNSNFVDYSPDESVYIYFRVINHKKTDFNKLKVNLYFDLKKRWTEKVWMSSVKVYGYKNGSWQSIPYGYGSWYPNNLSLVTIFFSLSDNYELYSIGGKKMDYQKNNISEEKYCNLNFQDRERMSKILCSINQSYFEGITDLSIIHSKHEDIGDGVLGRYYPPDKIEIYEYGESDIEIKDNLLHELGHHDCFKKEGYDSLNHRECFLKIKEKYGFKK